jgi:hypothetical protein
VLAVDGLPVIVKDGWGLRSDAFDTICDAVPDAWKIENGLNPTLPVTAAEFNAYIRGLSVGSNGVTQIITNVGQAGTFSFGAMPPGIYTVAYVDGAWLDSASFGAWCVDQIAAVTPPTNSITVLYNNGTGQDTGRTNFNDSLESDYHDEADAEVGAAGSYTSFAHYGGDISLEFVDNPYDDNLNGAPPPTYILYTNVSAFEAIPGLEIVYLDWPTANPGTSIDYNVYRSIGSTNSWSFVASTPDLYYADSNLDAGTTYYYELRWVNSGSVTSSIVSAVPFGCPEPLPPRIDYMNPLKLAASHDTFEVPYPVMLTNSDAFDPQGYPMVFEVDSVSSGSLTINGAPFGADNSTISNDTSVIWTPPSSSWPRTSRPFAFTFSMASIAQRTL